MWVGGEDNDTNMDPQFLGKTGCRENHSQWEETQEEGRRAEMLGEDHKGRFGQVELEMLI